MKSLTDLAHSISGDRHGMLMDKLSAATDRLEYREPASVIEFSATLFDEAIKMLNSPRPNYLEAGAIILLAYEKDPAFIDHWNIINQFNLLSHEIAMTRILHEDTAASAAFEFSVMMNGSDLNPDGSISKMAQSHYDRWRHDEYVRARMDATLRIKRAVKAVDAGEQYDDADPSNQNAAN